jgi:hypothetical protein
MPRYSPDPEAFLFFCERSLIVGASAWIPHLQYLDVKMAVPYFCWQYAEI